MSDIVIDSMAGSPYQDLHKRIGELGATWARNAATPNARFYCHGGKVHCGQIDGQQGAALYASGVPPTPDYTVRCAYTVKTMVGHVGIAGRMSTTANTYYFVYLDPSTHLILAKRVAGTIQNLDVALGTMEAGGTYQLDLAMNGTEITALVDGVEVAGATDTAITAAGRAGVRSGSVNDKDIGKHIGGFHVFDATVEPTARIYASGLIGL